MRRVALRGPDRPRLLSSVALLNTKTREPYDKPSSDSWRGEGLQGGGERRGDERVARSVPPHVCLRRFRVEAGGGRVHTHLCRRTRSRRAPVSPPTRHRRLLPTRAASAPPTRASSPCPCPTPLLLCLSALPLAVTTHAAVAAKVAVEQRLQRLPPRSPLPSALGLAAVKPRPPHALSSPRIRCAVRHPSLGLTSLLAYVNRRLTWAYPTLHDRN
jgi:hypothetical protein